MSNVKCAACGHVITHCPHCQAKINEQETEEKASFGFPVIPEMEIDLSQESDLNPSVVPSATAKSDWGFQTSLPEPEVEDVGPSPVLEDFFTANPVKPSAHQLDSDINPNPEIKRASITPSVHSNVPSEYSRHRVKSTYGNYDIEELTKIAVEQQFRLERRRKRRVKIIWRCIWAAIILFIIIKNWPLVVYVCKTFFGGLGAAMEIFSLLGDVSITPTP